ncbi:PilZ domain-containing protein [Mangrovitalea sediminis]|uniref:PilZ domain-containing protein n=1 Tax=Mangrovitalea sediminis TaxID=1982043 RepID=UPI00130445B6|nr:PilZ domain-containing protein [Mangrovitalea sediminis]
MSPQERAFIRHPVDIPIEVRRQRGRQSRHGLRNLSAGGLAFSSNRPLTVDEDVVVRIHIPDLLKIKGRVVWCEPNGTHYEVGLAFTSPAEAYKVRMVEQICRIEQYRRDVLRQEGRELSSEEAAAEWITRFADRYAQAGWNESLEEPPATRPKS